MTAADAPVPDAVRTALVRFAADVLAAMEPREVPASLRAVQRFAPRRRAEAGAGPLWAALGEDGFRAKVAGAWSQAHDELAGRLTGGAELSADDDPLAAVTGAWLLRLESWPALAEAVTTAVAAPAAPGPDRRASRLEAEVDRLRAELGVARDAERTARDELAGLRRELRRLRSDADRARDEARRAAQRAQASHDEAAAALDEAHREREAAAADRAAAEQERASRRAQARAGAQLDQVRARLLLDTIVGAASGLRDELALPPLPDVQPADLVAGDAAVPMTAPATSRGRSAEDPALLDELLRLPNAHLIVDGYNVTKTGWPNLTLEDQRRRLVDALALLAARTGAEVTCCFDGRTGQGAVPQPRGVRVLFSVGEIADDLIRRLVRAEPPGRAVVVVTGDQAVATDVTRSGARVLPSTTLLARLQRV